LPFLVVLLLDTTSLLLLRVLARVLLTNGSLCNWSRGAVHILLAILRLLRRLELSGLSLMMAKKILRQRLLHLRRKDEIS
jgi:predicted Na+-dependent transporter